MKSETQKAKWKNANKRKLRKATKPTQYLAKPKPKNTYKQEATPEKAKEHEKHKVTKTKGKNSKSK